MEKVIKTAIPKLDELLNGGFRLHSLVVLRSKPGVRYAAFAYQILNHHLEAGGSCVYLTNTKSSEVIEREVERHGWELRGYREERRLVFVDAYSRLVQRDSSDEFVVEDPKNPEAVVRTLLDAISKVSSRPAMIVFDMISTLIDFCGIRAIDALEELKEGLRRDEAFCLSLFVEWPYDREILERLEAVAEAMVDLKAVEEKVVLREYFTVTKAEWDGKVRKDVSVPFKVVIPGGVKVYIPKILVTGPYNAGKTSFVHSASIKAVSVDRFGTTVALDHGHVEYAGFSIDLFGTPGQERFDPILELLGGEALGVIVVLDSTKPETFPRAKEMLEKTRSVGLPMVVVANKADLEGALGPEQIRELMRIPAEVPIVPVRAEDLSKVVPGEPTKLRKDDVEKVLKVVFERIV